MRKLSAKEKKQVLVRLAPETKKAIRLIAAQNDKSVSAIIEQLVEASLALRNGT